jgi:hypothetical protein
VPKVFLLTAALLLCVCGMAWFALAKDAHWRQLRAGAPTRRKLLRGLGAFALIDALFLCLLADHASMAALVWVMALAASAQIVAFTLTWRPRLLTPLIAWLR